jgi:hypothetical protein
MAEKSNKNKGNRVNLSFNAKQIELIDSLIGEIGDNRADVVKTIFFSWLSEKGITASILKKKFEDLQSEK